MLLRERSCQLQLSNPIGQEPGEMHDRSGTLSKWCSAAPGAHGAMISTPVGRLLFNVILAESSGRRCPSPISFSLPIKYQVLEAR